MNGNILVSAVFVLATATANVLQKKAVGTLGPVSGVSIDMVRRLAMSPWLWGGLASYAVALLMYLVLLSRVPLNVATSIAAINFIAVLLSSRLILGEPIPALRYLGFACILIGVYIVSLTQQGSR